MAPWLCDDRSTLDLFGRGFTLLCFDGSGNVAHGLVRAAAPRRMPLDAVAVDSGETAALYEKPLVLVRPDGHIAWRGDTEPADPLSIIETVRGA